jgi:hypothetical protein
MALPGLLLFGKQQVGFYFLISGEFGGLFITSIRIKMIDCQS